MDPVWQTLGVTAVTNFIQFVLQSVDKRSKSRRAELREARRQLCDHVQFLLTLRYTKADTDYLDVVGSKDNEDKIVRALIRLGNLSTVRDTEELIKRVRFAFQDLRSSTQVQLPARFADLMELLKEIEGKYR